MSAKPKIPIELYLPLCIAKRKERPEDPENWPDHDYEDMRLQLGPAWGHMAVHHLRRIACNYRKGGRLGRIRADAAVASKAEPKPDDYKEYLKTPHWQEFRLTVIEFWGGNCAVCNQPGRDVHHRTYVRRGCEELTDCIYLCRECHRNATTRQNRLLGPKAIKLNPNQSLGSIFDTPELQVVGGVA